LFLTNKESVQILVRIQDIAARVEDLLAWAKEDRDAFGLILPTNFCNEYRSADETRFDMSEHELMQ
jgi:hypothetical protein